MGAVRGGVAIVAFPIYALGATAAGGGGEGAAFAGVVAVGIGVAAAVVWFPVSIVGGAVTAPPTEEIDAAEPVVQRIVNDPGLSERAARDFAAAARSLTGRDLVPSSDAETVVELRVVSIERGSAWNWWTFDRPFEVVVVMNARVVRRSDLRVVWEDSHRSTDGVRESVVRTYSEWARGDGAALREEIDAALSRLAAGFAHSVFAATRTDWLGRPVVEAPEPATESDAR